MEKKWGWRVPRNAFVGQYERFLLVKRSYLDVWMVTSNPLIFVSLYWRWLSLFYSISQFLKLKDSLVAGNPFVGQWPVFLCNIFHSWFNSRGFLSPWIKTVPFVWTEYEIPSQLLLKSKLVRFEKWHAMVLSVNVGDFFQTTFHPGFNWRAFEVLNTCG